MKRLFCIALATTFFALSAPAHASAQASIFVGGGATRPTGDFREFGMSDGAKLGWQGTVGAQFALGESRLALGTRGYYGSNSHQTEGDKTNLYGGTALLEYGFSDSVAGPFLWGEFGVMAHAFKSDSAPALEDTSTTAMVAGGARVGFSLGEAIGWISMGFTTGMGDNRGTKYFGTSAGVSFALD